MRQSSLMVVVMVLAFVVYTTLKGNLRGYLQVVGIA